MSSLVHGQPISAEEIERIVSREFSPETFVLLCNSVAWASTGKECSSLPSFTERIYVPDGGRDAEWAVEIAPSEKQASAFLSSGWNVYQYKHRDVSARNRAEIVSKLKADLKGALKDLVDRHKRELSKYVLFVNLHLTLDEQKALKAKIQHDYDENESTTVEIVEAAFLAGSLNNLPHLRSSFFSTSQFMTWQQAWLEHENRKIYGANISLTGRDEKLNALQTLIDNPEVRAVIISGAKDVGKTRLVLEATKHRAVETIVSGNWSIRASDLRYLESSNSDVIILVEDLAPNKIKELINQVLSLSSLKLIITVPTSENSSTINFGLDKRIETVQLSPLLEEEARELLKAAETGLDYAMESWTVNQAGGNPGILLLAAKRGTALRKEYGGFLEQIAKALEKEVQAQIDKLLCI